MTLPPIRKSLTVPLAPAAAFRLFTDGIDGWWPKQTHSLSAGRTGAPARRVVIEPRAGGRVTETLSDGSEAPWGTVTAWEPGRRFAMTWHVGRPPDQATRLEITFTAEGAGTRVEVIHAGFEAFGPDAADSRQNYDAGWDTVLGGRYADAAAATAEA